MYGYLFFILELSPEIWYTLYNDKLGGECVMNGNETVRFKVTKDTKDHAREIMNSVYDALKEKGYNPINQIVGYFLSGDPSYITSHQNARAIITKLERDELLEEIVKYYIDGE